tara:strand:- start:1232 stop:2905 length:1674 start_codon:yes stop_codon:yes gene_type:complete
MKMKEFCRNRMNDTLTACLLITFTLCLSFSIETQNVSFNENGSSPDPSAMLDVSATDKGILIPRMTAADRLAITSPANGLLVFQTNPPNGFYVYFASTNRWSRITQDSTLSLSDVLMVGDDAANQNIVNVNQLSIGNSSLNAKLQVYDPIFPNIRLSTSNAATSNAVNSGVIEFMENGGDFESGGLGFQMRYIASTSDRFQIRSSAAGIDTLLTILRGSGRMGVRKDAPTSQLHVNSLSPSALSLERGVADDVYMQYINSGYDLTSGLSTNGSYGIYNSASVFGSKFIINNAGNVGIAQTNPTARLHLTSASRMSQIIESSNTDGTWLTLGNNSTGGRFHQIISTGSTNGEGAGKLLFGYGNSATITSVAMTIDELNVGINVDTPATTLHVNHPTGVTNGFSLTNNINPLDRWHFYVWSTNNLTLYFNNATRGDFNSVTGVYSALSDIKFKKNISEAKPLLEKLKRLEVKEYHFIDQNETDDKSIGFIAQDLMKEFPSLVTIKEAEDGLVDKVHLVNYSGLGVLAIKAIQEQQEQINELENRIKELEKLIAKIQNDE